MKQNFKNESDILSRLDYYPGNKESSSDEIPIELLQRLNRKLTGRDPIEILYWGWEVFGKGMVLGTGFGPSGIIMIHQITENHLPVTVFYLDTHLLFGETYHLRDHLEKRFEISFTRVAPALSVEEQARKFGNELWKTDPEKCCFLRKVLPLQNYLADKKAWVTGVRRSQASTRHQTDTIEWDPVNRVIKINPLADWSDEEVWDYIRKYSLPYNPLHDKGYPSIGCIPCTEPAELGQDERSGRWKDMDKTECGIHLHSQNFQHGKTGRS